jgi:ABC-type oligopeptide transport system ATPase subunit
MTVLLEARGASRGPFARKRLLHAAVDLDVTVDQGDVLGIVGESGAGKSTFGKMLLGLLPPTRGAIRFSGIDVSTIAGAWRGKSSRCSKTLIRRSILAAPSRRSWRRLPCWG